MSPGPYNPHNIDSLFGRHKGSALPQRTTQRMALVAGADRHGDISGTKVSDRDRALVWSYYIQWVW